MSEYTNALVAANRDQLIGECLRLRGELAAAQRESDTWRSQHNFVTEREKQIVANLTAADEETTHLRARLVEVERQLSDYHRAVAAQLHYDAKSLLSGTPEERARVELNQARADCEAMRVENERLRGRVLRPLTEREIESALHEGRAEAMAATGDNAWTSLLKQRDALAAEVERLKAEVKGLRSLTMHHAPRATGFCDSCSRYSCTLRLVDDQMRCGNCTNITAAAGKESK